MTDWYRIARYDGEGNFHVRIDLGPFGTYYDAHVAIRKLLAEDEFEYAEFQIIKTYSNIFAEVS